MNLTEEQLFKDYSVVFGTSQIVRFDKTLNVSPDLKKKIESVAIPIDKDSLFANKLTVIASDVFPFKRNDEIVHGCMIGANNDIVLLIEKIN